jgi:hypothetical protein
MASDKQNQGIWFGPGQDDYLKWEVERRSGVPTFVLFFEQHGTGKTLGTMAVPGGASLRTLDLAITGDLGAGTLTASYRLNSDTGGFTTFATAAAPGDVLGWFSRQALAGIVVTNEATPATYVATYDSFGVTAP